MMRIQLSLVIFIIFSFKVGFATDWPQWRGPQRDGINRWNADYKELSSPFLLWESETIPSGDEGGFGSAVSDGKCVYLSIVWHRDVPTSTRTISDLFLRKLGARKINLPENLIEKAESDRLSLNPRLRGSKLEDWIEDWLNQNLDQKQKMVQGDLLASRFRQGKIALPVSVIETLHAVKNKPFSSQDALDKWLNEQDFDSSVRKKISESVPPTKRIADDTVIALDLIDGSQKWKTSMSGSPSGRSSSSTPCVSRGRLISVGSDRIFAVEVKSGKVLWDKKLDVESMATSPLCVDDKVVALVGKLTAFEVESGKIIWSNEQIKGKVASAIAFKIGQKDVIACNGAKDVFIVDAENGKTLWKGPGGGSSTPVFSDGYLLVHSKEKDVGLIAYNTNAGNVEEAWRFPKLTRRSDSSPLILGKYAYLVGAGMRSCFQLATGELIRKEPSKHDISSPVVSGTKIMAFEINGNFLSVIDSNPNNFQKIEGYKINALRCTSPALIGNKIIIRKEDRVACYEFR